MLVEIVRDCSRRDSQTERVRRQKETIFLKRGARGNGRGEGETIEQARKLDERVSTNNMVKQSGFTERSRFYESPERGRIK